MKGKTVSCKELNAREAEGSGRARGGATRHPDSPQDSHKILHRSGISCLQNRYPCAIPIPYPRTLT